MDVGPDLGVVTSALAEPARLRMLTALADGRALPLCELARAAGVRPPTAVSHVSRLLQAALVVDERCGRHRYFRLAGPQVGEALETLAGLAPRHYQVSSLRCSLAADGLAAARTCYDHLAGRLGVALHDAFLREEWLLPATPGYEVTPSGREVLGGLGIDVDEVRRARRAFTRSCLDWSERTHHLAGALGAAVTSRMMDLGWLVRVSGTRAVRVTPKGQEEIGRTFGLALQDTTRGSTPRSPTAA